MNICITNKYKLCLTESGLQDSQWRFAEQNQCWKMTANLPLKAKLFLKCSLGSFCECHEMVNERGEKLNSSCCYLNGKLSCIYIALFWSIILLNHFKNLPHSHADGRDATCCSPRTIRPFLTKCTTRFQRSAIHIPEMSGVTTDPLVSGRPASPPGPQHPNKTMSNISRVTVFLSAHVKYCVQQAYHIVYCNLKSTGCKYNTST